MKIFGKYLNQKQKSKFTIILKNLKLANLETDNFWKSYEKKIKFW